MDPTSPEFVPDSSLSRAEMETLQRAIAREAVFSDRLGFDPAQVGQFETRSPSAQTQLPTATGENQSANAEDDPLVAGVDQAFLGDDAISAIVVLRGGTVVERTYASTALSAPYIPGLLSFREGESIIAAFETLDCTPDLVCFDGSGRIHYRQAGLATHMGVVFDVPAIGIAKRLLCGTPEASVENRPTGWRTPVRAANRVDCPPETVIGYAYQSKQYDSAERHINPLYVSPGHRVAAETAVDLVARLCEEYKLPEPTRLADKYAAEIKAELAAVDSGYERDDGHEDAA